MTRARTKRLLFPVSVACAIAAAIFACTPLPDLDDDDSLVKTLTPIDEIDAAACDGEAAPAELCDRVRK